tara:strand:- start:913 stop:1908 length:996 start_codon:yes stop_codon:yes gene_type:complete
MAQIGLQADRIKDETPEERGELIQIGGRRALDVDAEVMMAQVNRDRMRVDPSMFSFKPETFGPVRIFEHPIAGEEYLITSDYAEGVSDTCDYNVIHVYKRGEKLEQVAYFREKCYPEESASEAIAMGAYYNMAWQVPEVNSCGAAALALFRTCYPVDRIFRRKVADNVRKQNPSDLMGWKMTGRSKAEAVSAATAYFKQGLCVIRNANTLRELEVFVKKSSRMLPEAMTGTDPLSGEPYHDDEVVCMVLAIFANRQLPYRGEWVTPGQNKKENECLHAVIAGGKCLRCRKEFPDAVEQPLTFDDLRSIVRNNKVSGDTSRQNALVNFWVGR